MPRQCVYPIHLPGGDWLDEYTYRNAAGLWRTLRGATVHYGLREGAVQRWAGQTARPTVCRFIGKALSFLSVPPPVPRRSALIRVYNDAQLQTIEVKQREQAPDSPPLDTDGTPLLSMAEICEKFGVTNGFFCAWHWKERKTRVTGRPVSGACQSNRALRGLKTSPRQGTGPARVWRFRQDDVERILAGAETLHPSTGARGNHRTLDPMPISLAEKWLAEHLQAGPVQQVAIVRSAKLNTPLVSHAKLWAAKKNLKVKSEYDTRRVCWWRLPEHASRDWREQATDFLKSALSGAPLPATELKMKARTAGIKVSRLYQVKDDIGVETWNIGGKGHKGGRWVWGFKADKGLPPLDQSIQETSQPEVLSRPEPPAEQSPRPFPDTSRPASEPSQPRRQGGRPRSEKTQQLNQRCYELYYQQGLKMALVRSKLEKEFGKKAPKEDSHVRSYARRYATDKNLPLIRKTNE